MAMMVEDLEPDEVDANLRRNVRILMAARGLRGPDLYEPLKLTRANFSEKLRGHSRFSAAEILKVAALLDVRVEDLAVEQVLPYRALRTGRFWRARSTRLGVDLVAAVALARRRRPGSEVGGSPGGFTSAGVSEARRAA